VPNRQFEISRELRRAGIWASLRRLRRSIRRHGFRAAIRRASFVGVPYWWHRLDLATGVVDRAVPQGIQLRRAGPDDLSLYAQLAEPRTATAAGWLAEGNDLWLALQGTQAAFACWIYRHRMPMGEAQDGWLRMPSGTVSLEYSVTSPDFRGQGIAPGAWSTIARELRDEGLVTLFTKVAEDNVGTQKSLAKVGFFRAAPDDEVVRQFARQLETA
jgi:GNAT superfamily N-acetyltransferase